MDIHLTVDLYYVLTLLLPAYHRTGDQTINRFGKKSER